jgi:putative acetyltransferase
VTTEFSSTKWRFRPSSADDLDRLYKIWHASVAATHDFVNQSDLRDICIQVKNDYLPNRALLVAVDSQDQLVGFMGMNGDEIESLFIDPKWRGRGLGRDFIKAASAQSTYLEVGVNAQNRQAVGFYESVGFTVYASAPTDDDGRPYPILRMRRQTVGSSGL